MAVPRCLGKSNGRRFSAHTDTGGEHRLKQWRRRSRMFLRYKTFYEKPFRLSVPRALRFDPDRSYANFERDEFPSIYRLAPSNATSSFRDGIFRCAAGRLGIRTLDRDFILSWNRVRFVQERHRSHGTPCFGVVRVTSSARFLCGSRREDNSFSARGC